MMFYFLVAIVSNFLKKKYSHWLNYYDLWPSLLFIISWTLLQLNPGELTRRLQQVKKEYASLVAEAQEIKNLQAQMCDSMKSQIQASCMALQHLSMAAPGSQVNINPPKYKRQWLLV